MRAMRARDANAIRGRAHAMMVARAETTGAHAHAMRARVHATDEGARVFTRVYLCIICLPALQRALHAIVRARAFLWITRARVRARARARLCACKTVRLGYMKEKRGSRE
eukprot:6191137-Pleurochrysis_carterae.AAC.2